MSETNITTAKPNVQPLNDSLGFIINALARTLRTEMELQLRETGLSPTTWTVLMALGEEDGVRQTELSHRTFLDGTTMTRALDILEAKDFIHRQRDTVDRRVQNVTLTVKGRGVIPKFVRYGTAVDEKAMQNLSIQERIDLEKRIRQIIKAMRNSQPEV